MRRCARCDPAHMYKSLLLMTRDAFHLRVQRSLEKIERCRSSESFVCHAHAATDNHGYLTNTEYFRISLIASHRFEWPAKCGDGIDATSDRSRSNDADRLPSSRPFLRMAPRIVRSAAHTTRKGVTSFSLNRSV